MERSFSSQEELRDWIDATIQESDALAHRALSLFLDEVRAESAAISTPSDAGATIAAGMGTAATRELSTASQRVRTRQQRPPAIQT